MLTEEQWAQFAQDEYGGNLPYYERIEETEHILYTINKLVSYNASLDLSFKHLEIPPIEGCLIGKFSPGEPGLINIRTSNEIIRGKLQKLIFRNGKGKKHKVKSPHFDLHFEPIEPFFPKRVRTDDFNGTVTSYEELAVLTCTGRIKKKRLLNTMFNNINVYMPYHTHMIFRITSGYIRIC